MIQVFNDHVINHFAQYDPDTFRVKGAKNWHKVFFLLKPDVAMIPCIADGDEIKVHVWARPDARGLEAVKACKDAVSWIFSHTKAKKITSRVYLERKEVQMFASMVLNRSHKDEKYIYYTLER